MEKAQVVALEVHGPVYPEGVTDAALAEERLPVAVMGQWQWSTVSARRVAGDAVDTFHQLIQIHGGGHPQLVHCGVIRETFEVEKAAVQHTPVGEHVRPQSGVGTDGQTRDGHGLSWHHPSDQRRRLGLVQLDQVVTLHRQQAETGYQETAVQEGPYSGHGSRPANGGGMAGPLQVDRPDGPPSRTAGYPGRFQLCSRLCRSYPWGSRGSSDVVPTVAMWWRAKDFRTIETITFFQMSQHSTFLGTVPCLS